MLKNVVSSPFSAKLCQLITWSTSLVSYHPPLVSWRWLQQPSELSLLLLFPLQSPCKGHNTCVTREQTFPCCFLYIFNLNFSKPWTQTTKNYHLSFVRFIMALWEFCAMFMQELVENVFSPVGVTVCCVSVFNSKLHRTEIWAVDEQGVRGDGRKSCYPERSSSFFTAEWKGARYRNNVHQNTCTIVLLFNTGYKGHTLYLNL